LIFWNENRRSQN